MLKKFKICLLDALRARKAFRNPVTKGETP